MHELTGFFLHDGMRLGLAAVLGGIIGLEREALDKPAGLRTNILICVGSTLMMILSMRLTDEFAHLVVDPTRISQGVIMGVGFLGAGTILHSRGGVTGLTTAATTWALAGIGLAVGGGFYGLAVGATLLILSVLLVLGRLAHFWGGARESRARLRVVVDGPLSNLDEVRVLLQDSRVAICNWSYERLPNGHSAVVEIDARRKALPGLISRISALEGIRSVGNT